jgi:uncharacterized membrane protein YbhN (UPF0104 family)
VTTPPEDLAATIEAGEQPPSPLARRHRTLKRIGMVVGLLLVAAAIVAVWHERATVTDALNAIRKPNPWVATTLLCGVAANVVLSGFMFSVLMSRYGRVGILEMQALLASATLLNFLPMRPGLFGRIAYHRAVNNIRAVNSAKTIVQASVISVVLTAYLAADVAVAMWLDVSIWWGMILPVPVTLFGGLLPGQRIWMLATFVRYIEVLVWALRYWASFKLIGFEIDLTTALAFACISMISTMLPFVSNGLGLREWGIGFAAKWLTEKTIKHGITAELVNRCAEIMVVCLLGLIGLSWLAHHRHKRRRALQQGMIVMVDEESAAEPGDDARDTDQAAPSKP